MYVCVYVHMCVCVYVCMYVCIKLGTHTFMLNFENPCHIPSCFFLSTAVVDTFQGVIPHN